jgi:hypothetical protein
MILCAATFLPFFWTDRLGRKSQLIVGAAVNCLSFIFIAIGLNQVDKLGPENSKSYAVLAVFGVFLFYTRSGRRPVPGLLALTARPASACAGSAFTGARLPIPSHIRTPIDLAGYASELPPVFLRNKVNAIGVSANWFTVFILLQITPRALANIGWRYYMSVFALLAGPHVADHALA